MWDLMDDLALSGESLPDERVLVVVVNHSRDWQRICEEHWYRIPVTRAPRQLSCDYLAFYHTHSFPDLRWAVHYYAPVLRYQVLQRGELLPKEMDHPRAAALYYKIDLGPLIPLPQPIPSLKLRRITFIPTTLPRLLRAREINDLWPREKARDRLWRALRTREINARRGYVIREGEVAYRTDLAVWGPRRKLAILCVEDASRLPTVPGVACLGQVTHQTGWVWHQFTVEKIMGDITGCVETVQALLEGSSCP